jgi:hypothetical protein
MRKPPETILRVATLLACIGFAGMTTACASSSSSPTGTAPTTRSTVRMGNAAAIEIHTRAGLD